MATIQSKGIFFTLVAQLDKLARHNRQGSFRTKERYYQELSIGSVIYEVHRIYNGSRSAEELVLERMLLEQPDPPFDEGHTGAV